MATTNQPLTIVLRQLVLASYFDPINDLIRLKVQPGSYSPTVNASVSRYAAGRDRGMVELKPDGTPAVGLTKKYTLELLTDVQKSWLWRHMGVPVWVRDPEGEADVCLYGTDGQFTPSVSSDQWGVEITFSRLSKDDSV